MSPFKRGDCVLILGGGPIGLAVIQALKAKRAGKIIVSEVAQRRKEFAKQFGAHYVLDPTKDDIVARVRALCDGRGAHIAFDAAGVQVSFYNSDFPSREVARVDTLWTCCKRVLHEVMLTPISALGWT